MENTIEVICPQCEFVFDVGDLLTTRIKSSLEKEYQHKASSLQKDLEAKLKSVETDRQTIAAEKSKLDEIIQQGVADKLNAEKLSLENKLRHRIQNEFSDQIKSYEDQLAEKSQQTKVMNKLKADLEKEKRSKSELQQQIEAQMEQRLTKELSIATAKIKIDLEKQSTMKVAEKDILINALKDQLTLVQRKAEQASQQLQGESQEIVLEKFLKINFPLDSIEEIKKGQKGGDILQNVYNSSEVFTGCIYYESKRSNREFQKGWIDKFKNDFRLKKATFGVIVTEKYPADMQRMGQKNGIWICSWEEFKALCYVLREMVLMIHQVKISQENKSDKVSLLYQYLCSTEFRNQLEGVVEGFVQMNEDLNKERRSLESLWKQREKQIQKALLNTTLIYSTIKGIAGSAVSPIRELEIESDKKLILPGKKS